MSRRRRFLLHLAAWAVAGLLLWWAVRAVSLRAVVSTLDQLRPLTLLALVTANGIVLFLLPARWSLALRGLDHAVPYFSLIRYRMAAFGLSYFTPGPQFGGEPLQVALLERHHTVPRAVAVASVTIDKALELVANFSFLAGGAIVVVHSGIFGVSVGQEAIILSLALLFVPTTYLVALSLGFRPTASLLGALTRLPLMGRLQNVALYRHTRALASESEQLAGRLARKSPLILLGALLASLATWLALIAEFWLMMAILGLFLDPVQLILLLTAARIAILLPLPGGLGTLEASQVLALGLLGLPPAAGLSAALLIRGRDVVVGLLGLWQARRDWHRRPKTGTI